MRVEWKVQRECQKGNEADKLCTNSFIRLISPQFQSGRGWRPGLAWGNVVTSIGRGRKGRAWSVVERSDTATAPRRHRGTGRTTERHQELNHPRTAFRFKPTGRRKKTGTTLFYGL